MTEDIFPVCSPALLAGAKPLALPEDLAVHTLLHVGTRRDEWELWLTAAGVSKAIAERPGLTFDQRLMALQAAMDGLGVALGYQRAVEADIAAGKLVVPFDIVQVAAQPVGYYVVAPEETADVPKIARFREWLMKAVS
jgi:LysR family glycine cleavage system transcriptional activator